MTRRRERAAFREPRTHDPSTDAISVFISYRRADTAGHVGRLHDHLVVIPAIRAGGIFRDIDSIQVGDDFVRAMRLAVEFADVVLAVIGSDWLSAGRAPRRRLDDPSDPVRVELVTAFKTGIPVIPVLVRNATMPARARLPAALRWLATTNAIEVSDVRFVHDVERLVDVVRQTAAASKRRRRRRPSKADAGPYYEMGNHYLQEGEFASARRNMLAAIAAQPDSIPARLGLSSAYQLEAQESMGRRNYGLAETLLNQAEQAAKEILQANDTDIESMVQLAFVRKDMARNYLERNQKADANDALTRAHVTLQMVLAASPKDVGAWNCLASLARIERNLPKAIEFGRRAVALDPTYTYAWYDLAGAYEARARRTHGVTRRAALKSLLGVSNHLIALEADPQAQHLPAEEADDVRRMAQWAKSALLSKTRQVRFSARRSTQREGTAVPRRPLDAK
jgi:Tfp pilus assembly protein PilF